MRNLLLLFASISALPTFAQYEIDEDDFGTAGDTVIYAVDSAYVDVLNNLTTSGDSVEWDFSELTVLREDTLFFKAVAQLPQGGKFSNATFGYEDGVLTNFMKVDAAGARTLGVTSVVSSFLDSSFIDTSVFTGSIPSDAVFKYQSGGLYYLDFPAAYGNSDAGTVEGTFTFYYGDSIMGFYADSIRITQEVVYTSDVDGYGEIKVPFGDYYGIRQNVWYDRTFSASVGPYPFIGYIEVLPDFASIKEHVYRFFGEYQQFPLVEVTTDSAGTVNVARYQTQPPGSMVGVDEAIWANYRISMTNDVVIVHAEETLTEGSVYDLTGKKVMELSASSSRVTLPRANALTIFHGTTASGRRVMVKIPARK